MACVQRYAHLARVEVSRLRYDVWIAGVGGQGTILASRILAAAAILRDEFARTGETIGMSQRGGCVVSNVRLGGERVSPYIPTAQSDLILGFELAETARNMPKLKPSGAVVVNTQKIKPVSLSLGVGSYDEEVLAAYIRQNCKRALFIDGYDLAVAAGSAKAVNIVLLGAACGAGLLPFSREELEQTVKETVAPRFVEMNLKAFASGFAAGEA